MRHWAAVRLGFGFCKRSPARPYGLVVVAEGARLAEKSAGASEKRPEDSLKASLSPLATGDNSQFVIQQAGQAAAEVAYRLQKLIAEETYPLVLGNWARCGSPTAVDRQLGLAYGAGAIAAIKDGQNGVMTAFLPPRIEFIPLPDAINKVRTVPADSGFLKIAKSLGIDLGA